MAYRNSSFGLEERRVYMREECGAEPAPGVFAYVDGEVAGRCSTAPRSTYRWLMRRELD